jgi:hypothetical protein
MIRIVVDNEQAKAIVDAKEAVQVCDESGKVLGVIDRAGSALFTAEEIARAKRNLAAPGPRYTTEQVLEHLRSLENQ